jgi:hypothetical protein
MQPKLIIQTISNRYFIYSFLKALRNIGRTPNYFVEQYGKCVGVNTDGPSEDLGIVYEVGDTVRNSLITLEVSADDMVLIYNRWVLLGYRVVRYIGR